LSDFEELYFCLLSAFSFLRSLSSEGFSFLSKVSALSFGLKVPFVFARFSLSFVNSF
jgi:hypothetical protein